MLTKQKSTMTGVVLGLASLGYGAVEITRYTVDGGGAMRSTGGAFEVSGTIGQSDAGALNGGPFSITGGFWFETPAGDANEDGVTGLSDLPVFEGCMSGPAGTSPTNECRFFDADRSGQIDLPDFAAIQQAFGQN